MPAGSPGPASQGQAVPGRPVISLIICAYTLDRWHDLCEAVASVRAMSLPPDEIILVSDRNTELFQRMSSAFAGLRVVENEEARGLSGARNTGVRHAKGQLLAFLDDDAIASVDWLSTLVRHFENMKVYGATSMIEPQWVGARPRWFPSEFLWTVGCSYTGLPERVSNVRNVMGAAMCFRREAFDAAGGFTGRLGRTGVLLPLSCEETELSIRVRRFVADAQYIYDPQSKIRHKVPSGRLTLRYFILRCFAEGISKQKLTSMFDTKGTLSTESNYVLKTLPRGILKGVSDVFRNGDMAGLGRAAAIVTGLSATTAGYVFSKISDWIGSVASRRQQQRGRDVLQAGGRDVHDH